MIRPLASLGLAALLAAGSPLVIDDARGQGPPQGPPSGAGGPSGGGGDAAKKNKNGVKSYDDVITKEAKSDPGLFNVHRVDDRIFYEIPTSALGKPFLWVTQIAQNSAGFDIRGTLSGERVVRWDLREDREAILLRDVKFEVRADAKDPINNAVEAASVAPIITTLPIRAYGKDKSMVIDVTDLFTTDIPELSVRERLRGAGLDPRRTFVEQVKSFPDNIEARVLATFNARPPGGFGGGPGGPIMIFGGSSGPTVTALVHHSMVKLPEEPMKPRRYDDRVGFFTTSFEDYSRTERHQVETIEYINRWRLEKKDPNADVSEPKKPIVYYIGREVPEKMRGWVKKGVEAWQPAFEKAGFKNAIIAKDAPTPQEDPDWDAEDARYSVIRWIPTSIENAMGPSVTDPRTGEILEADIQMYHNVMKLARDWYFVQASPNDPRAQTLPLPDDLVGELVAYVVAHEVGHTLGFPHNMKASSAYTVQQLRDAEFTKKNGTEASIMDYGRFNYVAQPGDNARLIPIIGPYDEFAVEWGYKQFKDANTYEKERDELEKIVDRQRTDPMLRFGDPNPGEDPSQQTEDLGSDPIAATELGLKNIDRVAGYLVKATCKPHEDYSQLQNMYGQLLGQRNRELVHVANVVGGFIRDNARYGDADKQYEPVPAERQKAAVAFLLANAFQTPKQLITPDITMRLEPNGAAERILGGQRQVLAVLMNQERVRRMAEHADRVGTGAYRPIDLMNDLTTGIFSELDVPMENGQVKEVKPIDLYRRNLQRAFGEMLIGQMKNGDTGTDVPALARAQLVALQQKLKSYKGLVSGRPEADPVGMAHVSDLLVRISQALDPAPAAPGVNVADAGE